MTFCFVAWNLCLSLEDFLMGILGSQVFNEQYTDQFIFLGFGRGFCILSLFSFERGTLNPKRLAKTVKGFQAEVQG